MFTSNSGFSPYWFIGVVVDKDDPTNNGRVRVRCIGVHPEDPRIPLELNDKDEKDYVEDQDLPWAWVINGTFGKMQCVPDEGEWVVGFFVDGRDAQHPMVIGSIAGTNTDTFGFGTQPEDTNSTGPGAEGSGNTPATTFFNDFGDSYTQADIDAVEDLRSFNDSLGGGAASVELTAGQRAYAISKGYL